jgi:hypothetical protein
VASIAEIRTLLQRLSPCYCPCTGATTSRNGRLSKSAAIGKARWDHLWCSNHKTNKEEFSSWSCGGRLRLPLYDLDMCGLQTCGRLVAGKEGSCLTRLTVIRCRNHASSSGHLAPLRVVALAARMPRLLTSSQLCNAFSANWRSWALPQHIIVLVIFVHFALSDHGSFGAGMVGGGVSSQTL